MYSKSYAKNYRENNKDKVRESNIKYKLKTKEKYKAYNKEYSNKYKKLRKSKDPVYRILYTLTKRLSAFIKSIDSGRESGFSDILGCSKKELKDHLNKGVYNLDDYTTNNSDSSLFHIDHIIPSSYFMHKIEVDDDGNIKESSKYIFKKWFNYRNLRIIKASENKEKKNTINYELIKEHAIEDLLI